MIRTISIAFGLSVAALGAIGVSPLLGLLLAAATFVLRDAA